MQKSRDRSLSAPATKRGIGRTPVEGLLLKVARRSYATTRSPSNLASVVGPDREKIELCTGNAS